jgi:hypothetical protein
MFGVRRSQVAYCQKGFGSNFEASSTYPVPPEIPKNVHMVSVPVLNTSAIKNL